MPRLHAGQQHVLASARRFNWLCAGRRWRKTSLALRIIVEACVSAVRAQRRAEFLWTAPTYRQVRIGWDELRHACADLDMVVFNETRLEVTWPGDVRIHFISLDDPDNARGKTADGIIIDEAAECTQRAWYEVLRPMLMDTGGWLWALFTPKGQNWVWTEFQLAADRANSIAWQIPVVGARVDNGLLVREPHPLENPDLPWREMLEAFDSTPERLFRQEILAEFLEDAGGVYRGVRRCIGGEVLERPPTDRPARYVMGLDLAKYSDYTVAVVADAESRQVVAFDRFNRADWNVQKLRVALMAKTWNNCPVWMDSTGLGDPIHDDLAAMGVKVTGYHLTHQSKDDLINNSVLMVEQIAVHYPEIPVLVNELLAYAYTKTAAGTLRMNAPEGMHDDAVIAFALCCWGMRSHTSLGHGQHDDLMALLETRFGGDDLRRKVF